ncbi:10322_t:CDS:1, partial [Entrophospora sp. SA101]
LLKIEENYVLVWVMERQHHLDEKKEKPISLKIRAEWINE